MRILTLSDFRLTKRGTGRPLALPVGGTRARGLRAAAEAKPAAAPGPGLGLRHHGGGADSGENGYNQGTMDVSHAKRS